MIRLIAFYFVFYMFPSKVVGLRDMGFIILAQINSCLASSLFLYFL